MPRLAKGGKWVFGWVLVSGDGWLRIPPDAGSEYGLCPGETVYLLRGSETSGGVAISSERLWPAAFGDHAESPRVLGQTVFVGQLGLKLPQSTELRGRALLAVRGSGRALGLIARGPIYAYAQSCDQELPVYKARDLRASDSEARTGTSEIADESV